MIVDERMVTFINSLDTENTEILEQIEKRRWILMCRSSAKRCRVF